MYNRRYAMLDELEAAVSQSCSFKNFQPQMDADGHR